jgi:hypothetical protein
MMTIAQLSQFPKIKRFGSTLSHFGFVTNDAFTKLRPSGGVRKERRKEVVSYERRRRDHIWYKLEN